MELYNGFYLAEQLCILLTFKLVMHGMYSVALKGKSLKS